VLKQLVDRVERVGVERRRFSDQSQPPWEASFINCRASWLNASLHATQLIELGRPVTEVAARLGHRNSRMTMEVYARWIQPDDSGALP